jgi:hypothetical protein
VNDLRSFGRALTFPGRRISPRDAFGFHDLSFQTTATLGETPAARRAWVVSIQIAITP